MDRIVRMKEIVKVVGMSRPTIYELIRAGGFPRPLQIGKRAVGWRESQITEWLESRKSA